MKRRYFFTLSGLSALCVVSVHAERSEPDSLVSWKDRYLSSGNILRVTPDKLIDQVEQLGKISGNPVRANGSHIFVQKNGQELKIKIHFCL